MNNFLKWLVNSSSNPENVSLTIRGILLQHVGVAIGVAQVFNLPLTDTTVIFYITRACILLGALLSIIGAGRKIYFLFKNPEN